MDRMGEVPLPNIVPSPEHARSGTFIAGAFLILILAIFLIISVLVIVYNMKVLEEVGTIIFFVFLVALAVYFYFKGAKSFTFARAHPYITFFLLIGIALSSTQTGLLQFIWGGPYTIQQFFSVVLNTFAISQTAQAAGLQGGFMIFAFIFGLSFTVFLILGLYDLISELIKGSLGHSLFPLRMEKVAGLSLILIVFLSFGAYTLLIWTATAISPSGWQINPFFGTTSFVIGAVEGHVSLSGITSISMIP